MGMDTSQAKTHIFYSPNKVLFGMDAVKDVAAVVKQLGGREVLIVTDPGVVETGLVEPVKAPLDSDRVPFFVQDQFAFSLFASSFSRFSVGCSDSEGWFPPL
jgi:hypothetical protein